ncbi:MAG: phage tail tape measure protein [Lactococcus sp.]|nr:phage tail tape measure protein [Lactococcus sp.]MDN6491083.1 phage tail tape measure protein [Leuconostoc sp.]MDN6778951.1 phage tail tape measure protein [Lactobacillus sp.]MDN5402869.1 phage tail tape measure protein [Lactococcus sp.]MDN5410070.1 phage tail tape measure protein [Lactococcus sp.]MDN5411183.1 phage tail tape measure protein [Lactococcus sp.]
MANKNIKGITIEIDGNTSGLDKALKSVNNSSVKLNSELKDVNKLLKFDPSNATGLAQKQELLTKAISNTSDKLNQLKSAQSQVEAQFKSGNIGEEQYRAFQREIATTEQSLKGYKSQLSGLQSEQEKLGQNTKRLNTFFEASGKSIDDFSDVLGTRLVNSIKNGTATSDQLEMALNKIGKEALGAGTDLNEMKQSLDKVDDGGSIAGVKNDLESLKVTSNSTDEELGKLGGGITAGNMMQATQVIADVGEKIKEVAVAAQEAFRDIDDGMDTFTTTTGQNSDVIKASFDKIYTSMPIKSTADLGQALGSLTQQFGFTGDKLTGYGTQLMQFAEINNTDVKSSVNNAKSAIETYGLSYDDLGSVLDTVTAVSQKTGVSVDDLMTKAVEGAPQIKALGLSFGEGTEMLGKFEQAGVDSSGALSSLSKANIVYAKDGKTLQEGLKGTIDSIKGAKTQTEALTIASEVFGTKGATRMVDAIQRGTFNLDELGGAAEKSSGTVKKTFESTVDPIDKQAVALQSAKLSFSELGATIAEGLQPILDALIPIIKSLGESFANMPTFMKTAIVVIGGLLVVFTALAPFIASIITIFSALSGAVVVAGGGMAFLTGALLPIIDVVVAVIDVIAAIVLAIKNWGKIVDWLKGIWGGLTSWFSNLWNGIKETISNVWQGISDFFSGIFQSIVDFFKNTWQGVSDFFTNLWTGISDFVSGIWTGIVEMATAIFTPIIQVFQVIFMTIQAVIEGIWLFITSILKAAWDIIVALATAIFTPIVQFFATIWDNISTAIVNVWNIVVGFLSGIWNTISTVASTVFNAIANFLGGIWNTISSAITTVWNVVVGFLTGVWNGISNVANTVFSAIASFLSGIWNGISNIITSAWNTVASFLSGLWNGISNVAKSVFSAIASFLSGIWNGIASTVSNVWNGITNTISNVINGIKNTISNVFEGIKNVATSVWSGIKSAITTPIEEAKNKISGIIDAIKGFFSNLNIKLPKIDMPPLPHFSLQGKFSLAPPSVPKLSVDWYAKGGILTKPTIFGSNGGTFMGGGEAGKEAVAPLSDLMAYVEKAVSNQIGGMESNFAQMIQLLTIIASKDMSLNMDGKAVMQIIDQHMNTQQQQAEFGIGRM